MKKYFTTISGGGIKFVSQLVAFITLYNSGIRPKKGVGVSAGSIVIYLYFCGRLRIGLELARRSFDYKLIFSWKNKPMGKIFGFLSPNALWKLLRKKTYLGKMDNLEKNLKGIITNEEWNEICKTTDLDCYVHCQECRTKRKVSFNLRYLSRDQAVAVVIGSCSIAGAVPSKKVEINGVTYDLIDGGHKDPSAGSFLLNSGVVKPEDFDECISIWSRGDAEAYNENDNGELTIPVEVDGAVVIEKDKGTVSKEPTNIGDVIIDRVIGYPMSEIGVDDELKELKFCIKHDKKYSPIHISIETEGTYSITKEQISKAEIKAKEVVDEYLNS